MPTGSRNRFGAGGGRSTVNPQNDMDRYDDPGLRGDPLAGAGMNPIFSQWDEMGATDAGRTANLRQFHMDPMFATRQILGQAGFDNLNNPFMQHVMRSFGEYGNLATIPALIGGRNEYNDPRDYVNTATEYINDFIGLGAGRGVREGSNLISRSQLGEWLGDIGNVASDLSSSLFGANEYGDMLGNILADPETNAETEASWLTNIIYAAAPTALSPVQTNLFVREVQNIYDNYLSDLWNRGGEYTPGGFLEYFGEQAADFLAWQFGM